LSGLKQIPMQTQLWHSFAGRYITLVIIIW